MKLIYFKKIKFYSGSFIEIYNEINKGGLLVAPAASALSNIKSDNNYYYSLKNSDVAILDSGFFCILLRIFKQVKVKKLSGYLFLKKFLDIFPRKKKLFIIDHSKSSNKKNKFFLKKLKIGINGSYIAPLYSHNKVEDKTLIKSINEIKPRYILINLGGGTQEKLGLYIKNKIKFKCSIICTGAAIAFMTGEQAPINTFIDKYYMGWLVRLIWNPALYYERVLVSFKLIKLFIN